MTPPRISIVIPTCDGIATLPAVLDAIERQEERSFETIVVDSGSRDGTVELCRARVDRLLQIDRASFDHGLTRNLGITEARGELVVLLVQDAVPSSPRWLAELTRPLYEDDRLAGAFARQIVSPSASRVTRLAAERWVASGEHPWRHELRDEAALRALAPIERLVTCAFDNVCSCVSRAVWARHPFAAASFAEDLAWAREVLLDGYRLAYTPAAAVLHSHDRSVLYELARTYVAHRRLYELFGLQTIPRPRDLLRACAVTLVDHARCLVVGTGPAPDLREIGRALGLALAWPLGQYVGSLSAARGWTSLPTRGI
jgi:rhamnosyltransferase